MSSYSLLSRAFRGQFTVTAACVDNVVKTHVYDGRARLPFDRWFANSVLGPLNEDETIQFYEAITTCAERMRDQPIYEDRDEDNAYTIERELVAALPDLDVEVEVTPEEIDGLYRFFDTLGRFYITLTTTERLAHQRMEVNIDLLVTEIKTTENV